MVGLSHQDIVECDDLHVIEPWPLHDFDLPLFKAAYRGDDAQVTFLVASGVDVNARSKCNLTPLQLAIHGDQADTVRTLLSAGADATIQEEIEPVSMLHVDAINRAAWLAFINAGAKATTKDADLDTPLHFAGNRCFAELLFKFGADLFAKDHDGFTPLHMACRDRRLDVAEFLLLIGAAVDATTTTKQWTPLLLATDPRRNDTDTERHEKLVKLLLSHGANVQATTSDGQTVLHNAAHAGNLDLVKYVVEHGVNVNAITSNGETAFHLVGHYLSPFAPQIAQRLAIIHFLLEKGAEINARDQTGSTPLHASWSCAHHFSHSPDMFNLFLKKGADRLATDGQMRTPIDLIDRERWMLDEDGFVCLKPKPAPILSTRGGRGGWRGRGRRRGD
ncbi:ankyrin repeat-containing domain protein [Bipolaris maydis]|nr:ankyrin repeat-containing domain protein [Bipolaris maydis]